MFKKETEWTLTSLNRASDVLLAGGFIGHGVSYQRAQAIYPTFYLKSNIMYAGGNGTIDNPYTISLW